jgi:hypothetical protein
MSLPVLLVLLAVAASVLLLVQHSNRLLPTVALLASGLQALAAFGVLEVQSGVVSLPLLFGAAILVAGVGIWLRIRDRTPVTAATVLALVGALQVLQALGVV